jgi:Cu(I)/Ag(I) efflux system membrane fusion protein
MRYLTIVLAACSLWMTSCTSNNNETKKESAETPAEPKKAPESNLDAAGTGKLLSVVTDYYALKDALVATSAAKADEAANKLIQSTTAFQDYIHTTHNTDDTLTQFDRLKPYTDTMIIKTKAVLAEKDETCEQKRVPFEKVSDAMFGLLKAANLKNAGVYRQYCPMAFNEKGAYWLSNETEIKNPYYGKKMLECGEVTDSLK